MGKLKRVTVPWGQGAVRLSALAAQASHRAPPPSVHQEPLVALALSWELHSPGPGTPSVLTGSAFAAVLARSAGFGLEYSGRD